MKNELLTINSNCGTNGSVQRASIEGIQKNHLDRDLRKAIQDKIKLESELDNAKETIEELQKYKKEAEKCNKELQSLYDQKNELQDKILALKEQKLEITTFLSGRSSNLMIRY